MGVAFGKRSDARAGEHIRTAAVIDAFRVRLPPGACLHRHHAGNNARRHVGGNAYHATIVINPHQIALLNAARVGVLRVDPELLALYLLKPRIGVLRRIGAVFPLPRDEL